MEEMGKSILKDERQFNLNAGMGTSSDRPPEFIRDEPLPPSNLVFDVSDSGLDSFWNF
jgi:aldehyde:ferredoxin oxidoreductase